MKTSNLPKPQINKDCKYEQTNCLVRLPCLFCAYEELIEQGKFEEADKTYDWNLKLFQSLSIPRFESGYTPDPKQVEPATEKQISYLQSLAQKQFGPEAQKFVDEKVSQGKLVVSKAISELIESIKLKEQQDKPSIKPGTYKKRDGTMVKVVISKTTGKPYGKTLDKNTGKWEYEPGAINDLF